MTAVSQTTPEGLPVYEPPPQFQPVGKKELDRSDFMTLFITQLQYQDPTKPMDSYEMASQLAQFSTLEATMKTSESMDRLLDYQISQNNLQLLALLDTSVRATGNSIVVRDGEARPAEFVLDQPVESCRVDILDAAGRLVRQLDLGPLAAGTHQVGWDGEDALGAGVADGVYTYQVDALTALGDRVRAEPRMSGRVTGVEFVEEGARLLLDDHVPISASQIVGVAQQTLTAGEDASDIAGVVTGLVDDATSDNSQ